MPILLDQAICIRQWDWSETSQTVSLFTREHGLVRGIGKGSKREKSAFSGGFELLTRGELGALVKPSADLANLTSWDLQETFPAIRRTLPAFYAAMYLADLVQHALHERDPHAALFDSLLAALRELDGPESNAAAVLRFQWSTLVETGYRPVLDADIVSGGPLAAAKIHAFLPRQGGFTVDPAPPSAPGPVWRIRAETLELLRGLSAGGGGGGGLATLDRASRFLAAYLREILGREVPAAATLFGDLKV